MGKTDRQTHARTQNGRIISDDQCYGGTRTQLYDTLAEKKAPPRVDGGLSEVATLASLYLLGAQCHQENAIPVRLLCWGRDSVVHWLPPMGKPGGFHTQHHSRKNHSITVISTADSLFVRLLCHVSAQCPEMTLRT